MTKPYFKDNIPVLFGDEIVGTASVREDMHVDIALFTTDTAIRLHALFLDDLMDHISLNSALQPKHREGGTEGE